MPSVTASAVTPTSMLRNRGLTAAAKGRGKREDGKVPYSPDSFLFHFPSSLFHLYPAIPFLNASSSAGVIAGSVSLDGFDPPLASRSGPMARLPADADACVDSACLPFERLSDPI